MFCFVINIGLIYLHKETWDISVLQAFVQTLFPELAQLFWEKEEEEVDEVITATTTTTSNDSITR